MTGQGQGRYQSGAFEVTAEVRAVNNRHLKLQTRTTDGLYSLEPKIEALVRSKIKRGSLQLHVQMMGGATESQYHLEEPVLAGYWAQCHELAGKLGLPEGDLRLTDLLDLPGVVSEPKSAVDVTEQIEQAVLQAVTQSLENLNRMRTTEGESMTSELLKQLSSLQQLTEEIEQRAPLVVQEYRERLGTKLNKALAEVGATLQEADLIREVLIMADKADIREELVRLRSHFGQFQNLVQTPESQGRKLDFLIQEMFREANTIGSKCGDAEMAQRVVDIKTIIEQMREQVQNVE